MIFFPSLILCWFDKEYNFCEQISIWKFKMADDFDDSDDNAWCQLWKLIFRKIGKIKFQSFNCPSAAAGVEEIFSQYIFS
jgi:hypothetical protein